MLLLDPSMLVIAGLSGVAALLLAYTALQSQRRPRIHRADSKLARKIHSAQSDRQRNGEEVATQELRDPPTAILKQVQVRESEPRSFSQESEEASNKTAEGSGSNITHDQLQRYFQEVADLYKLPPLPAVVTKALQLLREPNVDVRALCRVLTNDAAVAGKILGLSRSSLYGLRRLPNTLQEAIQTLGLHTLRRTLLTAGVHTLFDRYSQVSGALWDHSLATGLAAQILQERAGGRKGDEAFLAGLLHDVGQMVVMHGDPKKFDQLWQQTRESRDHALDQEREMYQFDHTRTGAAILYRWHLEMDTITAVLGHHNLPLGGRESHSLTTLLQVANYLADQCNLGFLSKPLVPPRQDLAFFECESEEAMNDIKEQISQAFFEEKKLLRLFT